MLPGLIAGHYDFNDCHIDLDRLARKAHVRFVNSSVVHVDAARRRLDLNDGSHIDYDLLSIDVGSTPATAGIANTELAIAVKPFPAFARSWDQLLAQARDGKLHRITGIGSGAAGVEVLLAMQYQLAELAPASPVNFELVSDSDHILADHNAGTRAVFERVLNERGIVTSLNARVGRVERDAVILSDGRVIATEAVVLATGAGAPSWFSRAGLALDARGFIAVDERLVSISHAEIFAAGDCATIQGYRYPKSGVYAVRQGPVLAENLRRMLAGEPLANYRPQPRALSLISTGDKYAVGSYGPLACAGTWVWRWKDYIDRKFVRRYSV
jgi:selenide,water dikinase